MAVDPLSPIAPARVRVLVLPAGRIKRQRFMTFVERLQQESIVRLGDISPDGRPNSSSQTGGAQLGRQSADGARIAMFAPMAFPNGALLYNFSTAMPPPSNLALTPFELFREPVMVIGIADAEEYQGKGTQSIDINGQHTWAKIELEQAADGLREHYPKILVHQLLIMDCVGEKRGQEWIPEGAMCVPAQKTSRSTSMKTVMCDISAIFLSELTTYAKAVQALPSVQSPGLSGPSRPPMSRAVSFGSRAESPTPAPDHLTRSVSGSPSTLAAQSRTASPPIKPPTSFDEIANAAMAGGPLVRSVSRADNKRTGSRDRMSMQAFGSSNTAERARSKGKARVGIVIGNLYMLAGRWSDAWRELVENTNKSRIANDNLWYAKGLESVLVCMLLFIWAGYDFTIPAICYSGSDRPSSIIAPNGVKDGLPSLGAQEPEAAKDAAQRLAKLLPDLIPTILGIYERASTLGGETIPPVAYSEGIIRKTKLMALVHNANGQLDSAMVGKMVSGRPSSSKATPNAGYITGISKYNIAEILFRAYPPPNAQVPLQDETKILAGIASVLSMLGLERKKAVVIKELIASLVPALVQARKVGAAEMGIHPAASLSAAFDIPTSDQQNGLDGLLNEIHSVYGARASDPLKLPVEDEALADEDSGIETLVDATIIAATNFADTQAFGSLHLKIDILRACIDFCEALPDLAGIVGFAALLLRIAGPHSAVTPGMPGSRVKLATEEQIRLISNMSRTSNAANKVGVLDIQVPYWDDFLVRNVQWHENVNAERVREHHKPDIDTTTDLPKRGPLLYDPFAKHDSKMEEKVLVAGEHAELVVTLQNPYDFDVKIERLTFATEGVSLEVKHGTLVLGPARIQNLPVAVRARDIGKLKILGCVVKFVGCLEQVFPIYSDSWSANISDKVKDLAIQPPTDRATRSLIESQRQQQVVRPVPFSISTTVIQAQPHVIVEGTSLSESATMVLEGQRKTFQVMLRNTSTTTSVDFVHVSFDDSLTASIRLALSNKELTRAETHELERQISHDPVFTWARADSCPSQFIGPGEKATFDVTVLGRPGLGAAKIMFDYAYLGKPLSELQGRAYTRQVVVPVDVTVNASVQLHRIDFADFPSDFAWSNQHRHRREGKDKDRASVSRRSSSRPPEKSHDRFKMLLDRVGLDSEDEEHCLVLLDLRNAWPNPLTVSVEVRQSLRDTSGNTNPGPTTNFTDGKYQIAPVWKRAYTVHEVIHPGHIARLVLLLPKMQIANPYAPIPLQSQHQRQFVVSADRNFSPDFEMATREQFWFREEILKYMRGSWKEEGNSRQGGIDLRGIRLGPRMIDMLRLQDLDIALFITPTASTKEEGQEKAKITQLGKSTFQVQPETFTTLTARITNRSPVPIRGILRLQPSLAHQLDQDLALDIGRKLMVSGLLQQALPTIAPAQSVSVEVGLCPVVGGEFEIQALVEETVLPEAVFPKRQTEAGLAGLVGSGEEDEDFSAGGMGLKPKERRIWRAGEGCRLVVVAEGSED